jgi:response regulator RpfG family c-di-GMP phosphodiesterase
VHAEVFALVDPDEFGRAIRVQRLVRDLALELGAVAGWEVEVAAVVSRLGSIIVPTDMMRAARQGARLRPEEQQRIDGIPEIAITLLRHVPRMDLVVEIISHLGTPFDAQAARVGNATGIPPIGARLLKAAHDFDTLVSQGLPPHQAANRLRARTGWYDPTVLDSLIRLVDRPVRLVSSVVAVSGMTPTMVLADDLYSDAGVLLLKQGVAVNEPIRLRLELLAMQGVVPQNVRVLAPPAAGQDDGGE